MKLTRRRRRQGLAILVIVAIIAGGVTVAVLAWPVPAQKSAIHACDEWLHAGPWSSNVSTTQRRQHMTKAIDTARQAAKRDTAYTNLYDHLQQVDALLQRRGYTTILNSPNDPDWGTPLPPAITADCRAAGQRP